MSQASQLIDHLQSEWQSLRGRWSEIRAEWKDEQAEQFESRVWDDLQRQVEIFLNRASEIDEELSKLENSF